LGIATLALACCAPVSAGAQDRYFLDGQELSIIFTYTNFSSVSGLTCNGNSTQDGTVLLGGPSITDQVGSVFYTNQVDVAQGFITLFTLQIIPNSNSYTTADGMAFVVQSSSVNAIGDDTGQPGYDGIADSVAVEFDTFQNFQLDDPNNNHVGVQSCGTGPNSINHGTSCNLGLQLSLPLTLADGNPHEVAITYMPTHGCAGGNLSVTIDKQKILISNLNLSTLLSLNGNDAWVGFTAGSGEAWESGIVRNWAYASVGTAPSR
jgi:Legume lectin domain